MRYGIDDLLHLMRRLRANPGGCPWDLEQTATTIINYSLEEVYELADAIERCDNKAERDELGDLLFQVVFLARIAEEQEHYDFADVVHGVCEKLVRRHPHVFSNGQLYAQPAANGSSNGDNSGDSATDAQRVAKNWEAIKRDERRDKQQHGLFADTPLALPALQRARKIQQRAAFIGLDWPNVKGAMASLESEVEELGQAISTYSNVASAAGADHAEANELADAMANELGDVLFSCVNVARKLGLNPEQCLRHANTRFIQRAEFVAERLPDERDENRQSSTTMAELDALWKKAKDSL